MPYELPPLPYAYNALEAYIDGQTMHLHHDKHHRASVTNANTALAGTEWAGRPVDEALQNLDQPPDDRRGLVRNNAVASSFEEFQANLEAAGAGQFGTGWARLVHDGSGLTVESTPNQDTPISGGEAALFGGGVWERAYYLRFHNIRPDYIDAWWNVVDWAYVAETFATVSETPSLL